MLWGRNNPPSINKATQFLKKHYRTTNKDESINTNFKLFQLMSFIQSWMKFLI